MDMQLTLYRNMYICMLVQHLIVRVTKSKFSDHGILYQADGNNNLYQS